MTGKRMRICITEDRSSVEVHRQNAKMLSFGGLAGLRASLKGVLAILVPQHLEIETLILVLLTVLRAGVQVMALNRKSRLREALMRSSACYMMVCVFACVQAVAGFAGPAEIVESSGVKGGVVVHIGCADGTGTVGLCVNERYVVQGLDVDAAAVEEARKEIMGAGCYGQVSARVFDGRKLPYVDNLVNLIVADADCEVSRDEILRVLTPLGVAMIGEQKVVKGWPEGMDEWNHFLHGPDNNAVARDEGSQMPRAIQWVAEPRWGRSHEEMASMSAAVSAKGRIFAIMDRAPLASIRYTGQWELMARDAFNGKLLWTRKMGGWSDHLRHFRAGPLHLPRRLVASGERVYVTLSLDGAVGVLDAATGRTLDVLEGTERTEEILVSDGVVYLVVGTSEVNRRGGGLHTRGEPEPTDFRYIAAFDEKTGERLWKHSCDDEEFLLPLSLAVGAGGLFYQSTEGVVRLDGRSGERLWRTPRLTPGKRMSFSPPTVVAAGAVLLAADRIANQANAAEGQIEWGVHGWNEKGFPRRGKSILRAYSVADGKEMWSAPCSEDYNTAVDVFVVGDTVWVGADYRGYDLHTGELRKQLKWKGAPVGMAHHRCYRNKATEQYIFTGRSGIEVVSLADGWLGNNSWIRGTCQYGIMPCNGLVYAPPNACACFPKVKVSGFFAAAGKRGEDLRMPLPEKPVLEKGPAYGLETTEQIGDGDWPTYRHDVRRSGVTPVAVEKELVRRWSTEVGGKLTQPVVVGKRVFVASTDRHSVYGIGADDGRMLWSFAAGGRVDSSPTIYGGKVLFGSSDGWVYAVRADDGRLVWRFRAAPEDMQAGVFEQLESVWPVHGAVLVQNDTVYAVAGRSTYLDCGIVLYRLNPRTGEQLSRTVVCDLDPETGQQVGAEGGSKFDMEGSLADILSGDGQGVFMKHLSFTSAGLETMETKAHLFSVMGFLGEEWFVRNYWLVGTQVGGGWGNWADAARQVPAGRILCFGDEKVYGYGRVEVASAAAGHKLDAYHLFARENLMVATGPGTDGWKKKRVYDEKPGTWSKQGSLVVRAMVVAGDKVVVAGVPDLARKSSDILAFENEAETLAAFRGRKGVFMAVVAAHDGQELSRSRLEAMPVFDGMSSSQGRVYVSLKDGWLECWGE